MPYFTKTQTGGERNAKVVADIFCALLLGTFLVIFFGWVGGLAALIVTEACLLALDWLVPSDDDVAAVIR